MLIVSAFDTELFRPEGGTGKQISNSGILGCSVEFDRYNRGNYGGGSSSHSSNKQEIPFEDGTKIGKGAQPCAFTQRNRPRIPKM